MALETVGPDIFGYLFTVLNADATIAAAVGTRIYEEHMPTEVTTYPVIVCREISPGTDVKGTGETRIWVKPLWLVEAIAETRKWSDVRSLGNRIIAVLHTAKGGHAAIRVDWVDLEREFRLVETNAETNKHYRRLGGEFRIAAMTA